MCRLGGVAPARSEPLRNGNAQRRHRAVACDNGPHSQSSKKHCRRLRQSPCPKKDARRRTGFTARGSPHEAHRTGFTARGSPHGVHRSKTTDSRAVHLAIGDRCRATSTTMPVVVTTASCCAAVSESRLALPASRAAEALARCHFLPLDSLLDSLLASLRSLSVLCHDAG